ncbi:Hypothetical protein DEACI_0221 [Acididesulfobacillus acetoxydans]|uniref:Uncharacterized protein n=1 Tax=Acididesulfobacillus acetoxydans TaxID=1561005 RepID=A0A8S0Y1L1_9FIRM|nr:Hypothetical protein DEACI_0221 [Acididesulfobacillus acetoxydans]CEJ07790.1 Hypothetical protein DEACI_2256 [Acididesulfobacillus acetoxydans]
MDLRDALALPAPERPGIHTYTFNPEIAAAQSSHAFQRLSAPLRQHTNLTGQKSNLLASRREDKEVKYDTFLNFVNRNA